MSAKPGFFERLTLALRILGDADLAARVRDGAPVDAIVAPTLLPPTTETRSEKVPEKVTEKVTERIVEKIVDRVVEKSNPTEGALQLLSILQRDGRLVDFVSEDLTGASDADVGAAARVVHAGVKKALGQYFTLERVRKEAEESAVVVDKGFDPAQIRLAGKVSGEPPFKGRLTHAGWRAVDVRMPERTGSVDGRIVAPAEVEIA